MTLNTIIHIDTPLTEGFTKDTQNFAKQTNIHKIINVNENHKFKIS
jgi:hypothetical protein